MGEDQIESEPVVMWAVFCRARFAPDGRWYLASGTISRTRSEAIRAWREAPGAGGWKGYERKRQKGLVRAAMVQVRPWRGHPRTPTEPLVPQTRGER